MTSEQHLAETSKFVPEEPVTVGGYPITCPACGAADGIRYWVHRDADGVSAEHTCVPFDGRKRSRIRRWDEPRVTREFVRDHGVDLLAEFNTHLLPIAQEIRERRRQP
ncbi:hypothetical protein ETD83_39695 [Actinomadura soli]|uniref:Uncharacterized protein n=1 Tax=Actinomadura soli TaxID=2508997 RepID=A0A5C4IZD7_9ACTN|nr:hypothetical protein [Actinomadura soli]TMQ87883.1 hypothetical protein ETD83_39695 [Actinomadura soli]